MKLSKEEIAEIRQIQEASRATRRATVPELEALLYEPIPVLDHGFVRVIDYMGNDAAVVQAARVSYGVGTKRVTNDRGLIRYLMRHRHTTPFEMCEIKLHIKLPIFVARQWIRHRTASVNEYSARYSILDKEFYLPDRDLIQEEIRSQAAREKINKSLDVGQADMFGDIKGDVSPSELGPQSLDNKQGRDDILEQDEAKKTLSRMRDTSHSAYNTYEYLLNEKAGKKIDQERKGVAREIARLVLPVNYYTQWYWKTDLHNLFHFLSLRASAHAQYEIRRYALTISDIVSKWVPICWEAHQDYVVGGAHISRKALEYIKKRLSGDEVTEAESELSAREWRELMALLERDG